MNAREHILEVAAMQLKHPISAGINGPYNDPETKCRNLSHWVIIFSKCFEWTGDIRYQERVSACVKEILNAKHFPDKKIFYHRKKSGKDKTNGLIGQAWTIEALDIASKTLNSSDYKRIGIEVFLNHSFDEAEGLWRIMTLEGNPQNFDPTFNHQLWFAASGAPLSIDNHEIRNRITRFLDLLHKNLTVLKEGLIYHLIDRAFESNQSMLKDALRKLLLKSYLHPEQIKRKYSQDQFYKKIIYKSVGYHSFNIYAFVLISKHIDHPFFKSKDYNRITSYLSGNRFFDRLDDNSFSYPYNAPGFEMPYILESIYGNEAISLANRYLRKQLSITFEPSSKDYSKNNPDPATLTARLYELTRTESSFLDRLII